MAGGMLRAGARVVVLALAVAGAACGLFDFDVNLSMQKFSLDFGQQTGTMPAIACDATAGACSGAATFNFDTSSAGVPSQVDVALGCDAASGQCYAQATARAVTTVGV